MTYPTTTNTGNDATLDATLDRALDSAALVVRDNGVPDDEATALTIAMIAADVMHIRMDRYDATLVEQPVDSCYFDHGEVECPYDCASLAVALPAAIQRFMSRRDAVTS